MKRIYIAILLAFTTYNVCNAQLLWKVNSNKTKKTSYIFGNQHLVPVAFLDSVKGLYKAFNESSVVISEFKTNSVDAASQIQKAAIMAKHQNMKEFYSDADYNVIDKELKSVLKIGLNELSIMHPSFILSMYKIELFKQLTGVYDDAQSDSYFQQAAAEKGKQVIGLETLEQHLDRNFNQNNIEKEAHKLLTNIQNKDSLNRELLSINKLYKKEKINDLYLLSLRESNFESSQAIESLHVAWMEKLPALLKDNSCFIDIDIEHLMGENGIIAELQKAGFKVKPLE